MVEDAYAVNAEATLSEPSEAKVEVAVPPKYALWNTERSDVDAFASERRPVDVRLAVVIVPVAVRFASERLPENSPFPCTERFVLGVVVPMPHEVAGQLHLVIVELRDDARGPRLGEARELRTQVDGGRCHGPRCRSPRQRIRLNHITDSIAATSASTVATAANSAVTSVSFFSITSLVLRFS